MIPKVLNEMASYLKAHPVNLRKGGSDFRTDSAESENIVIQALQNAQGRPWKIHGQNVSTGTNRSWYDMKANNYLIDIKVSALKGFDNTNAKSAIYYLLTGRDPKVDKVPLQEVPFFASMRKFEDIDENRDFYYLVVNKTDPKDVFVCSLKGFPELQPNPSNLPFQAKWTLCRKGVTRSWSEAREYLLEVWADSITRGIRAKCQGMPASYPEFFPDGYLKTPELT